MPDEPEQHDEQTDAADGAETDRVEPDETDTGDGDDAASGTDTDATETATDTADEPAGEAEPDPIGADLDGSLAERTVVQNRMPDGASWPGRTVANEDNLYVLGELRVYYDGGTTVALPMDGDAGVRILGAFRYNQLRMWEDRIDVTTAPADVSWVGISMEGVLAMLWIPGLPRAAQPQRMTVDPVTV